VRVGWERLRDSLLRRHLSGVIMVSIAPPVGGVLVARGAVTMEKSVLLYASECHR
jgi:hypothetical protein